MRKYTKKEIDFKKQNPQMTAKEIATSLNVDIDRIYRILLKYKLPYKQIATPHRVSLTDREIEVMEMFVQGYKYTYIAEKMGVSFTTIKTHLKNIRSKLLIDFDNTKHNALTYTVHEYLRRKEKNDR